MTEVALLTVALIVVDQKLPNAHTAAKVNIVECLH